MDYPEHEKLQKVSDDSRVIGEFIEWLRSEGYEIAEWDASRRIDHRMMAVGRSINDWLALYFGIDQQKLDAEKRAMLDEIPAVNA